MVEAPKHGTPYVLIADRFEHAAGTTVYLCDKYDYGCSRDDEFFFQTPHRAFTLREDGDYPFFTVPLKDIAPSAKALNHEA